MTLGFTAAAAPQCICSSSEPCSRPSRSLPQTCADIDCMIRTEALAEIPLRVLRISSLVLIASNLTGNGLMIEALWLAASGHGASIGPAVCGFGAPPAWAKTASY
jgi:hypothetical protein